MRLLLWACTAVKWYLILELFIWGRGAIGSAIPLQGKGCGFKSHRFHHIPKYIGRGFCIEISSLDKTPAAAGNRRMESPGLGKTQLIGLVVLPVYY